MRKIWDIAQKDIYNVFTDRNLILIMIVTPLAIATIIALAFSNISSSAPLRDIPVALVNLDEGADNGFSSGDIFTSLLIPPAPDAPPPTNTDSATQFECNLAVVRENEQDTPLSLFALTEAVRFDDADAARRAVDSGDYAAAIIIPPDFSQRITYSPNQTEFLPTAIEVYASPAYPISASVVRSITEAITNQILTGQISIGATIDTLIERAQTDLPFALQFLFLNLFGAFEPDFSCAFSSTLNPITLDVQSVAAPQAGNELNMLVVFGSSLGMFFALFTANGGASNILEESRNWTLQRLLVSPTSRLQIMAGKMLGIFGTVFIQLVFLMLALMLVNMLITGEFSLMWGNNPLMLALLLVAGALGASGVGAVTAAIATSAEQANVIGGIVAMFMGIVGGAFFQLPPTPLVNFISSFSIVHWGSEAFRRLSLGDNAIGLHLLVLIGIGGLFFFASLFLFNRRQDLAG